jgi:hypothetical protein
MWQLNTYNGGAKKADIIANAAAIIKTISYFIKLFIFTIDFLFNSLP